MTHPDNPNPPPWTDRLGHQLWLHAETLRLLDFGLAATPTTTGSGWLDVSGGIDPARPVCTWVTARMAHVYALGHLLGVPGSLAVATRALDALRTALHDDQYGGWYASLAVDGTPDTTKSAYAHAFVVLAAATGTVAGIGGAPALLDEALEVLDERFWEPGAGLHADEWDRAWTTLDPYRGVNANMHAVEALLAAGDATGQVRWHERAAPISDRVPRLGPRQSLARPGALRCSMGRPARTQLTAPRRPVQTVWRHSWARPGVVPSAATRRCGPARAGAGHAGPGGPRAL